VLTVKRLSVAAFKAQVLPFLLKKEVENNLMIGLAHRYSTLAEAPADSVWLALEDDGQLVAAALRTPPQYVTVGELPPGGARLIADFFVELGAVPDGASGPDDHGRDVLTALAERTGGTVELRSAELIYSLTSVRDVPIPPGRARLAVPSDRSLLVRFFEEFFREVALPYVSDAPAMADRHLEGGTALLWDDAGPKAIACVARSSENGAAIAPVYTPPGARRRGYAAAVTRELARQLLVQGNRFVCLFAEQKNATANHVYQSIGFERVRDFNVWSLR
jgi:predicted GNAT family acetyltransferase